MAQTSLPATRSLDVSQISGNPGEKLTCAGRLSILDGVLFKYRNKRLWLIGALAAGLWLVLAVLFRSFLASLLISVTLAAFAGICLVAMRGLGINSEHPLVRSVATRPWRDGRDVFRLATGRLSGVFIVTPKGSLLAPGAVDVRMSPGDVESLTEVIDLDLANELAVEAYEIAIREGSARLLGGDQPDVRVIADPKIPSGRYAIRQRVQLGTRISARMGIRSGLTSDDYQPARTKISDEATMTEQGDNPILQLITGQAVAQTRVSGARAGRGQAAEMVLPDLPTVSRVHARFTCSDGQWAITCLGRNGVLINGAPLKGTGPIHHGDLIRWGRRPDAPTSRVEII